MGWVSQTGDTVIDKFGMHFVLGAEIGRGGEGTVFATQAGGAAVKIIDNSSVTREYLEKRISQVTRLPVLDLPVAIPRSVLTGSKIGYSMTLVTGMVSLSDLILPSVSSPFTESWYRESGGIRKRLLVLEALAEVISSLHARGLVYCDLSANNVLVSKSIERSQLFLIDLDNLRYSTESPRRIWTSPYSAPEQSDLGASQSTDDFCLAILVFSILTGCNPFYGQALDVASPEEYENLPFAKSAPWIDDPSDRTNQWSLCIDRRLVISPLLYKLLAETFTTGRFQSKSRHSAAEYAIAIRRALHALYKCKKCGWDNYVSSQKCESCGCARELRVAKVLYEFDGLLQPFDLLPLLVLDDLRDCEVQGLTLGLLDASKAPCLIIRKNAERYQVELRNKELQFLDSLDRIKEVDSNENLVITRKNRSSLVFKFEKLLGTK